MIEAESKVLEHRSGGLDQRKIVQCQRVFHLEFPAVEYFRRKPSGDRARNAFDENQIRSQIRNLPLDVVVQSADNRRHPDHRGHADHNSKNRQKRPQLIFDGWNPAPAE